MLLFLLLEGGKHRITAAGSTSQTSFPGKCGALSNLPQKLRQGLDVLWRLGFYLVFEELNGSSHQM